MPGCGSTVIGVSVMSAPLAIKAEILGREIETAAAASEGDHGCDDTVSATDRRIPYQILRRQFPDRRL